MDSPTQIRALMLVITNLLIGIFVIMLQENSKITFSPAPLQRRSGVPIALGGQALVWADGSHRNLVSMLFSFLGILIQ